MSVADVVAPVQGDALRARPAGLTHDITSIAGRALRAVPRDLEAVMPSVFIALFFFIVNVATLSKLTQAPGSNFDYEAFQMPTAILLGVTGVSRAGSLVLDVQDGYLDRLLMTPVRRFAILVGHMVADIAVSLCVALPIVILGFILGVRFESGVLGLVAFFALAALWSLAFAGFSYAIALKTGNPAAVQSSFLLFFPFLFLTTAYVPRPALEPWLDRVAGFNPVTYLLQGLRSLVMQGWEWGDLGKAILAVTLVSIVSMSLCFSALRGRTKRG